MSVLGTVTIGQAPRPDVIPELRQAMGVQSGGGAGDTLRIIEAGALDGLTLDEVRRLEPESGDYVLITKMADGTAVKIAERHILPRMQFQIDRLARGGADVIALVCTGEFPAFSCDKLLVEPQKVLHHAVAALAVGRKIGVLLPDEDQVPQGMLRWSSVWASDRSEPNKSLPAHAVTDESPCVLVSASGQDSSLRIEAASPYGAPEMIEVAASKLRHWGAELIVMDCIGYTLAMKKTVKDVTRSPVILARSILGRTLAELL